MKKKVRFLDDLNYRFNPKGGWIHVIIDNVLYHKARDAEDAMDAVRRVFKQRKRCY